MMRPEETVQPGEGGHPSFRDLGIPSVKKTEDTLFGKRRTFQDMLPQEIIFLVIAVLSLIAVFVVTVYSATKMSGDDFTFAVVLAINTVFCIYYVTHGVIGERPYEIMIFIAGCVLMLIYIILNYTLEPSLRNKTKLARLIVMCILGPVNMGFASWAAHRYYTSRSLIFRMVGAEEKFQDALSSMNLFTALLKADFQLSLSMLVLVLKNGRQISVEESIILGVGVPLTLAWCILGYLAIRFESMPITSIFGLTSVLVPAYMIYKLIVTVKEMAKNKNDAGHSSLNLEIAVLVCAAAFLIIRCFVLFMIKRVSGNYGIGLKEKVFPKRSALGSYNTFSGDQ